MIVELIAAQAVATTIVHIPLDMERDVKDTLTVSIKATDTIVGGCLDRVAKRALVIVEPKDGGSRVIIRDVNEQSEITLPEGMWTTLPYKVDGEYRLAYQKDAVRTNALPIMYRIVDPHVQEVRINLETRKLEPSRSLESMDALSASFEPTRNADKALYELLMKHYAGVPVWDVHLLNSEDRTYIATVPTARFPIIHNDDFTKVWDVVLFPRLTGESSAGLRIVTYDVKVFGVKSDVISAEVGMEWSAFTFQGKRDTSPGHSYGTYISRLVDEKLQTKYLGNNIVVMPKIRNLTIASENLN